MKLKKTSPCRECPFRKKSLAGWLGKWTLAEISRQVHGEVGLTCHMQNKDKKIEKLNIDKYYEKAHACVGGLISANKSCKIYSNPELNDFQRQLKGSPHEPEIMNKWEFEKHHGDAIAAIKEKE
jgi:hypothetical protein